MDNASIQVVECSCDVAERSDCFRLCEAATLDVIAQRLLGPRHDQHVLVPVLAAVDYRHDIPSLAQIDEQQFPLRFRDLWHELGHRVAGKVR